MLWSVWQKLFQYRQHRTSNTHRTEPIENALMGNPIKGCTEINLHNSRLLPTLQCTLQCMGHAQKCIWYPEIPISKLGGAFYKSSNTSIMQILKCSDWITLLWRILLWRILLWRILLWRILLWRTSGHIRLYIFFTVTMFTKSILIWNFNQI